jgi:SAM-dependent methyltransferase
MSFRIALARMLLRAGEFLRTLPVVVLRPEEMVEWTRQRYELGSSIYAGASDVESGLTNDERTLWDHAQAHAGRILILGGGGGREAIFFARQGLHVTVIDFSIQMLEQARNSMAQRQFTFEGWVGDIACFDAPHEQYNLVWISMFLYSAVLTRARRVEMLRRIHDSLKPGGVLVVSFHWQPNAWHGSKGFWARKVIAWLTLGNTGFENGDILFGTLEFRHAFRAEQDLRAEFNAGGFEVRHLSVFEGMMRGGAVLCKPMV